MNTATAVALALTAIQIPDLKEGERWAGIAFVDGKPSHHVILLAGDVAKNWDDAMAWAKEQGGELPTRKEQALLFANLPDEFKRDYYWSGEPGADDAGYAWCQHFSWGNQLYWHKSYEDRARAVRRLPI